MKKNIPFLFAIICIALITLSSCNGGSFGCITGFGTKVTQSRTVSNFSQVDVQADAKVMLFEDTAFSFTATGPENLLENLDITTSGGKLFIRQRRCVRHRSNVTITIHAPLVSDVEVSGSADVVLHKTNTAKVSSANFKITGSGSVRVDGTIHTDNLYASITGSGDLNLPMEALWASFNITGSGKIITSGKSVSTENFIGGSGKIESFQMEATDTYIDIDGSGKCQTFTTGNLDVDISGSGNVIYKGWPRLTTRISGSGKVEHIN